MSINSNGCKLIVVSGPSGVGKDSLVNALLNKYSNIYLSISTTTRHQRNGEVNGLHYYFITRHAFKKAIDREEFLEWAEYEGNFYGTSIKQFNKYLRSSCSPYIILLILDIVGAATIKNQYPSSVLIFISPPSIEELEKRIRNRNLDSEEAIKSRMKRAQLEIEEAHNFDYVVINDGFDMALEELSSIVEGIIKGVNYVNWKSNK